MLGGGNKEAQTGLRGQVEAAGGLQRVWGSPRCPGPEGPALRGPGVRPGWVRLMGRQGRSRERERGSAVLGRLGVAVLVRASPSPVPH